MVAPANDLVQAKDEMIAKLEHDLELEKSKSYELAEFEATISSLKEFNEQLRTSWAESMDGQLPANLAKEGLLEGH
eukprot:4091791-Karenia_brevis.AAC.1